MKTNMARRGLARIRSNAADLLPVLLWGAETLMFPTWRNLFQSFEAWEYNRMRQQIRRLEKQKLLRRERRADRLVYRLTETGRLAAMGGSNPEKRWARRWDGKWRIVLFDLPAGRQLTRQKLLRWFRLNGFGYLQDSAWVHPDSIKGVEDALQDFRDDVESLIVMEARCYAGYSDEAIVRGAWDFDEINKRYQDHIKTANALESRASQIAGITPAILQSLHEERQAWAHAISLDPLLPEVLLPSGYAGRTAWQTRRRVLSGLSRKIAVRS